MSWFSTLFNPLPLLEAIQSGKTRDVRRHLRRGVDLNRPIQGTGAYLLHCAVQSGVEVVRLLVEHGANVNARDENGNTPLHIAAFTGGIEVARFLVLAGADVKVAASKGHTTLFASTRKMSALDTISAIVFVHLSTMMPEESIPAALVFRAPQDGLLSLLRAHGATPSQTDLQRIRVMAIELFDATVRAIPEFDQYTPVAGPVATAGSGGTTANLDEILFRLRTLISDEELLRALANWKAKIPFPTSKLLSVSKMVDDYVDRDPSREEERGTHMAHYEIEVHNRLLRYLDDRISWVKTVKWTKIGSAPCIYSNS